MNNLEPTSSSAYQEPISQSDYDKKYGSWKEIKTTTTDGITYKTIETNLPFFSLERSVKILQGCFLAIGKFFGVYHGSDDIGDLFKGRKVKTVKVILKTESQTEHTTPEKTEKTFVEIIPTSVPLSPATLPEQKIQTQQRRAPLKERILSNINTPMDRQKTENYLSQIQPSLDYYEKIWQVN